MKYIYFILLVLAISCSPEKPSVEQADNNTDSLLLTTLQQQTFQYFWKGAASNSGMARERIHIDEPEVDTDVVTTGGSGFGLMALIVGVERGFISRDQFLERINTIITFLENADRFHGIWPHWLLSLIHI